MNPFYITCELEFMEQTLYTHAVQNHLLSYRREIISASERMLMPQEGFQSMQTN
jgi:hypothetical protein